MTRTKKDVFQPNVGTHTQQLTLGWFDRSVCCPNSAKLRGMVRGDSPIESQVAAARVLHKLSAIQCEIIKMLGWMGSSTARELEEAPSFAKLAPSTVRKRLSELKAMGRVVQDGRKDGMAKWRLVWADQGAS